MNNLPLVTIGAINYNNSKFLIETLDSIKNQSYPNIELIIADDCSTDNSIELIHEWLKEYDKPFKFITHKENIGICRNCNSIVKEINGKYFSLIATDDIMMPDKIKNQVALLENADDQVAAVYSDAYMINEDSSSRYGWLIQKYKTFEKLPSGNIYVELLQGNFIPVMSVLLKTAIFNTVGLFDEELEFEDYDMWLRIAKRYKIIASDYPSVKYRLRAGSLSVSRDLTPSYLKVFAKHLDQPEAIKKLRAYAFDFYISRNKHLDIINNLSVNDSYLNRIKILAKYRIPLRIGVRLLNLK